MQEYEIRFRVPTRLDPYDGAWGWGDTTVSHTLDELGVVGSMVEATIIIDTYLEGADDAPPLRHRLMRPQLLALDQEQRNDWDALAPGERLPGDREEVTVKLGKGKDRCEYNWPLAGPVILAGGDIIEKIRWSWTSGQLKMHIEAIWPKGKMPLDLPLGYIVEVEGPPDVVDAWVAPAAWVNVTGKPGWGSRELARNGVPQ